MNMTTELDRGVVHNFVKGRVIEPDVDSPLHDMDPATGAVVARFDEADAALVGAAPAPLTAAASLIGAWSSGTTTARADVLHRSLGVVAIMVPWNRRDPRSSYGGLGLSGIGREGGEASLQFYAEPTDVCVQL